MTFKNSRQPRGRWAWQNTPEGLAKRSADADAQRLAIAATLPPAYTGPEPGSVRRRVLVLDEAGEPLLQAVLYVPTSDGLRCDQHPAEIDGARCVTTATAIGVLVARAVGKRPSVALLAEIRRDEWAAAQTAADC